VKAGLKGIVLGPMDDKDEGPVSEKKEGGDAAALTAVGADLLAAIAAKDAKAIGLAFRDAHDICAGYGDEE
jgi:hypothetical protein